MPPSRRPSLIMVPAWRGQQTFADLRRRADAGIQPRTDYVELAVALDADVMDMQYMTERATVLARVVARSFGIVPAQVIEAFLRQRRYDRILARADRLGLPLALLFKLTRGRRNTVLVSVWLSRPKKAVFLSHLKVHTHLAAIVNYGSVQRDFAAAQLKVPAEKLHLCLQPVDERFWRPHPGPSGNGIVSVGSEARDYTTLVRAIESLDMNADIAVGGAVLRPSGNVDALFGPILRDAAGAGLPSRIRVHQQLDAHQLRRLYQRARFVVVPLQNVEFDAGVTAIAEAMAMSKAVVVTRTRGQVDLVRDGENGLYVPPRDPAALRAAIQYLLDNPEEADRMGRAGRAMVESRLTLDRWVRDVADIVESCRARLRD
jgi:glycosyltransferase involved in cell wall biosynthesis